MGLARRFPAWDRTCVDPSDPAGPYATFVLSAATHRCCSTRCSLVGYGLSLDEIGGSASSLETRGIESARRRPRRTQELGQGFGHPAGAWRSRRRPRARASAAGEGPVHHASTWSRAMATRKAYLRETSSRHGSSTTVVLTTTTHSRSWATQDLPRGRRARSRAGRRRVRSKRGSRRARPRAAAAHSAGGRRDQDAHHDRLRRPWAAVEGERRPFGPEVVGRPSRARNTEGNFSSRRVRGMDGARAREARRRGALEAKLASWRTRTAEAQGWVRRARARCRRDFAAKWATPRGQDDATRKHRARRSPHRGAEPGLRSAVDDLAGRTTPLLRARFTGRTTILRLGQRHFGVRACNGRITNACALAAPSCLAALWRSATTAAALRLAAMMRDDSAFVFRKTRYLGEDGRSHQPIEQSSASRDPGHGAARRTRWKRARVGLDRDIKARGRWRGAPKATVRR